VKTFFRAGFMAHLTLVVLISVGAYTGMLPTHLPAVPHLDKLGHAILIGGLAFLIDLTQGDPAPTTTSTSATSPRSPAPSRRAPRP